MALYLVKFEMWRPHGAPWIVTSGKSKLGREKAIEKVKEKLSELGPFWNDKKFELILLESGFLKITELGHLL